MLISPGETSKRDDSPDYSFAEMDLDFRAPLHRNSASMSRRLMIVSHNVGSLDGTATSHGGRPRAESARCTRLCHWIPTPNISSCRPVLQPRFSVSRAWLQLRSIIRLCSTVVSATLVCRRKRSQLSRSPRPSGRSADWVPARWASTETGASDSLGSLLCVDRLNSLARQVNSMTPVCVRTDGSSNCLPSISFLDRALGLAARRMQGGH